jgi:hypothetical protein
MHDVSPENQVVRHTIAHAFMRWTRGVGAKFRTLRHARLEMSKSYAITSARLSPGAFCWPGVVRALHAVTFRAELFPL